MANHNAPSKSKNNLRWLPVHDLEVVQQAAQRPVNEAWVAQLMRDFNPDSLGVIIVAERNGSDTYHIIDGQHRVEALKRLGLRNRQVPCLIKASHEVQDEATWFLDHNNSKKVSAVDRFNVAVTAGDTAAAAIRDVLAMHGVVVSKSKHPGHFAAISAAERIVKHHGIEVFAEAVEVALAAWPADGNALHGAILQGIALALVAGADAERLQRTLAKSAGPLTFIGYARSRQDVYRGALFANVAGVIAERYNTGLRSSGRLDLSSKGKA
jgi:hypothetical protein